jgi:hypothetical protein
MGMSGAFLASPVKQQQWRAFLSKSKLEAPGLAEVIATLRHLLAIGD